MKQTFFFLDYIRLVKYVFLPIILTLLVSSWGMAEGQNSQKATELFEQANILHTQGEFQQATELYTSIINEQGVSASLLYNLGNSYAAAGQIGPAVLNYERALHLTPGDADIQGNLDQIRKDAGLYRDDQALHRRLLEVLGADQWLLIAGCAFFCLGVGALLATQFKGKGKDGARWLMIGALVIVFLTLPPAFFRYLDWDIGVVLAEDAHLVISPFADAASAGNIKAGRLVKPTRTHGDYVFVQTETGKTGWLAKDSFGLVRKIPGR